MVPDPARPAAFPDEAGDVRATFPQLLESEQLRITGQIAVGVTHEIGNLLTIIVSTVEILGGLAARDPGAKALVDDATASVSDAAKLLQSIATLGRRTPPRPSRIEVDRLLERIGYYAASSLPRGVAHAVETERPLPRLVACERDLLLVLLRLLFDAAHLLDNRGSIVLRARPCSEIPGAASPPSRSGAPGRFVEIAMTCKPMDPAAVAGHGGAPPDGSVRMSSPSGLAGTKLALAYACAEGGALHVAPGPERQFQVALYLPGAAETP